MILPFLKNWLFEKQTSYKTLLFSIIALSLSLFINHATSTHIEKKRQLFLGIKDDLKKNRSISQALNTILNSKMSSQDFLKREIESKSLLDQLSHQMRFGAASSDQVFDIKAQHLQHTLVSQDKFKLGTKKKWTLSKPVLIDEEDLKKILCLFEKRSIFPYEPIKEAPFFYFQTFNLKKTTLKTFEQAYLVHYTLESIEL